MSLITCCPACATMFKVVPDQLRISEGWVRCGHCAEVFDATAHMVDPAAATGAAAAAGRGSEPPLEEERPGLPAEPAADPVLEAAEPPVQGEPDLQETSGYVADADPGRDSWLDEALANDTPAPVAASTSRALTADSALVPLRADALPGGEPAHKHEPTLDGPDLPAPPFALRRSDRPDEDTVTVDSRFVSSGLPPPIDDDDEELDDLSFVREARRKAFWRRPAVRGMLALLLLALLVALGAQWAVHERDRLAAWNPQLAPWLARMCEPLGCRIRPPRRIDAITIDSSTFNKLRPDAFRLSFTLRNQSSLPVAVPALELTLTDTQDEAVLRRVLMPRELGGGEVMPGSGDWSANVALTLNANGVASRVAGYRLLAFYP